jgi:hypothetical protein
LVKTATIFIFWAVFLLPWHSHWRIHPVAPVKQAAKDQEASSDER